jgi:type III secretion protein T
MDRVGAYLGLHDFLYALAYTQPRVLGMFAAIPIFNQALIPGMLRLAAAAAVGALAAPALMDGVHAQLPPLALLALLTKEAFVGFAIGYALAIPFWAFEAVGFIIDNQRGASISATLNPLTGNDSSPLGILFNQAFIVFFFVCGGFSMMLGILYDSFRLFPVFDWVPTLHPETVPLLLAQLDRLVYLMMLYAAPVVVAMFLAELGLALVSRFVPQLQVFFLAMPIKSALAVLVLMMYAATLFDQAHGSIEGMTKVVPALQDAWQPSLEKPR